MPTVRVVRKHRITVPGNTPGAYVPYEQLSRPLDDRIGFVWMKRGGLPISYSSLDDLSAKLDNIAKAEIANGETALEAVSLECDLVIGNTTVRFHTHIERNA